METLTNPTISATYAEKQASTSLIGKFFNWTEGQQKNRLLWLGIILTGHGCIITPLTVFAVVMAGTNLYLFMLALMAMMLSLVTNLAALPTKVTIPAFVLSIVIDIIVVISCVFIGFDINQTYI